MRFTHLTIVVFLTPIVIFGCATNDSNSRLVRFWNDGFVYSEKKSDANQSCSHEANKAYPKFKPGDALWESNYSQCMKKFGY